MIFLVHIQEYGLRIEEVAWFCYSTSRAPVASAWVFITFNLPCSTSGRWSGTSNFVHAKSK